MSVRSYFTVLPEGPTRHVAEPVVLLERSSGDINLRGRVWSSSSNVNNTDNAWNVNFNNGNVNNNNKTNNNNARCARSGT